MFGLMLMQVFFTGGSKKASADHSDSARIVTLPSVMTMYMADTRIDTSAPAPFNQSVHSGIMAGGIQDAKKNTIEICYCIAYSKIANSGDGLSSKQQDAGALLTNDQAMLINTAILLGYNKQNFVSTGLTTADRDQYFATQALVWIIKEGYFDKPTERAAAEKFFFEKMPSIKTYYQALYNKVVAQVAEPSFVIPKGAVTTQELKNIMKYNATNKKFEYTLTNTNKGAMNNVKVDTSSLPKGMTATINGDSVVLTSTEEYKNGTNIKFIKTVSDKGGLVAWKNMGGDKQPQVTIDYDLAPIAQTFEVTVRTEPIASIQPVDPPKQEQPKVEDPKVEDPKAVEPEKKEEPNYQTKEVVTNKEAMDASPKTADESSVTLAYKLIGASLFTMMALYIVSIINKRKQKF